MDPGPRGGAGRAPVRDLLHAARDVVPAAPDIDLTALAPLISSLTLPFVTVDLALRADGTWRVIELGDGQVSDRPVTTEPAAFLAATLARP